jgi:hypothetical protein
MNSSELKAFMEEMHKEAADALSKLGMMKSR